MNVLMIYGGKSVEHDISVLTACIARSFFATHKLFCVYLTDKGEAKIVDNDLPPFKHKTENFKKEAVFLAGKQALFCKRGNSISKVADIDCVVNCCHGGGGEDGSLSGLLSMCGFAQAQCGVLQSALFMDKAATKTFLSAAGVPTVFGAVLDEGDDVKPEFPVVVKPLALGSSVGVSRAENADEYAVALAKAFYFSQKVIVERALCDFVEVNCSALRVGGETRTSDLQFVSNGKTLTFDDKYRQGDFSRVEDQADVLPSSRDEIKRLTKRIYDYFDCDGTIRVDFFVCGGDVYCNEINTIPGTLAYGLWEKQMTKKQFGNALIENALSRRKQQDAKCCVYPSDVLERIKTFKK